MSSGQVTIACFASLLVLLAPAWTQDLAPRTYIITPIHSNAITMTYSFHDGDLLLEGALPIEDSTGTINTSTLSFFHSLNLFGRSANAVVSLPYAVGNFSGKVNGSPYTTHRSGLLATVIRFSVNLKGGPAMSPADFRNWRQKTIIGASLKVVAPTGQYDPSLLINTGNNRWAFKPEIGLSHRWGQWVLDTYGAVWFFTENPEFFSHNQYSPGTNTQTQAPVGAVEAHLSYDFKEGGARSWVSADANFWYGGRTSVNGIENPATLQANSRIGATASVPVSRHHSIKFSYSYGAIAKVGGKFQNVSFAWQYSWLGRPN